MARTGLEALNETYRTGDVTHWRSHVEAYFAADVTLETGGMAFTEGEWRGHDGVVGFVANQMDVLEGMWIRIDDLVEVGDNALIVGITFGGRARLSGIDVELSPSHVFDFRDEKIVRWRVFRTREEAFEATGSP